MVSPKARRSWFLIPVAVVMLFGALLAAASAQEDVTYTGCLTDDGRIVRVAIGDEPASPCLTNQTEISWSRTGPQGLQGDPGPEGPIGPKGDKGDQGEQGLPGLDGNLALAGQECPDGTRVAGFDSDGDLICGACVIPEECVPEPEVCNGADDDCNEIIDDNLGDPPPCDLTDGVCAAATATCTGVAGWYCDYAALPLYEVTETLCDEADNDCDGLVDEHVDFATDATNCGWCGNDCSTGLAGNDATDCVGSTCQYSCDPDWTDCDGDLGDGFGTGCETNIATDLNNCGGCGIVCDLPNASSYCNSGHCNIESCDIVKGDPSHSWTDCDGNDANGCERSFDYPPGNDSLNPIFLGSGPGDEAGIIATATDYRSVWYQVEITENVGSLIPADLRAEIALEFAPPIVYWLYVYDEAWNLLGASNSIPIVVEVEDNLAVDDSFVLLIEIRYYNFESCDNWTLTVTGGGA